MQALLYLELHRLKTDIMILLSEIMIAPSAKSILGHSWTDKSHVWRRYRSSKSDTIESAKATAAAVV